MQPKRSDTIYSVWMRCGHDWSVSGDLFIYFIYLFTIFQEGDIFSSTASLPYGPLNI